MFFVLVVCLAFTVTALPNILSDKAKAALPGIVPHSTVPLGLDLRGGAQLLLEVNVNAYMRDHAKDLANRVRAALRKAQIGYTGGIVTRKDGLQITLRPDTIGDTDVEALMREQDEYASVSRDGNVMSFTYDEAALKAITNRLLVQSIEIVERRVNETGTKEPVIARQGDNRILVQVPGLGDPEQLKTLLGKTARMTFHLVNESITEQQLSSGIVPAGTTILKAARADGYQTHYAVYSDVALSGELLTNANASYQNGLPVVEFSFNTQGARIFGDITADHIGRRFAVVLDDAVITAPVIRSAILGGRGIIEGNFDVKSANELAILLRAGALPAPLDIIEERSVGPSLGQDSIDAGMKAAVVATALIAGFMMLSYGLFGVFACVALAMNIVMLFGALSIMQATLTLPGIAGMVLTMGMAVDANVLIFERIRDEIAAGKSPVASIDSGFKVAFGTIFDSNITTLIAALLLFVFGSGTVKGFAVTLSVGILCSMFTAILLTRLFVVWWVKAKRPTRVPI